MVGIMVAMVIGVEISQDKEASEPKSSPPEWKRDPVIQPVIIPRRGIIAHDGRSVFTIVIIDVTGLLTVKALIRRRRLRNGIF